MDTALHPDLAFSYELSATKGSGFRFDGKDVAVAAAKAWKTANPQFAYMGTTSHAAADGNGCIVTIFSFTSGGSVKFEGELSQVAAKPSILVLFEAINDQQASCRRAMSGDANIADKQARIRAAQDVFVAKLEAWSVADKFDMSALYD
jgi:hypothetical protein